jgi:hypothetical protein
VKVVQRIPVKIVLDPVPSEKAVLRPGMNVEATVCDLKAYVRNNDREELVLESVNLIRSEGGEIVLRNLFGEENGYAARCARSLSRRVGSSWNRDNSR